MTTKDVAMATGESSLYSNIMNSIEEITEFVFTPQFQAALQELRTLPAMQRAFFVESVLLSKEELRKRGIIIPERLLIQRSTFADARPTLFCVSKEIHGTPPWHKVTITFDNEGAMVN